MSNQRPKVSRLQFSLRAVLLLLTVAALAGWWRQTRFEVKSSVQEQRITTSGVELVELHKTQTMRRHGQA